MSRLFGAWIVITMEGSCSSFATVRHCLPETINRPDSGRESRELMTMKTKTAKLQIVSVRIELVTEESPDLSHLGTYSMTP